MSGALRSRGIRAAVTGNQDFIARPFKPLGTLLVLRFERLVQSRAPDDAAENAACGCIRALLLMADLLLARRLALTAVPTMAAIFSWWPGAHRFQGEPTSSDHRSETACSGDAFDAHSATRVAIYIGVLCR